MLSAIVLAAGKSQRMGTQKMLLPWAGQTIIGHVVDQVIAAAVPNVLVVVSHRQRADQTTDAKAIASALVGRPVTFVVNPDPEGEMLSSIRCGLRALSAECTAAMIVLGDQPAIRTESIGQLIHAAHTAPEKIIVPSHYGKRGHPIVLPSRFFGEALSNYDTVGLRGLLDAHANNILEIAVADRSIIDDLDFPDDYRRALAVLAATATGNAS
ncbi:MAG TPA: nucleotidyltransferase family protein [Pirellulales bacterium]|jgi:molybdenum cofactor cytidylyltransferase